VPTAIEIFKHLPKTNCGKCGLATCLAFAMQLANGKAKLESCPFVSEEGRAKLAESSAPPVRPVTIGAGPNKVETGAETELFRHEKRFVNQTAYAIVVDDDLTDRDFDAKLARIADLRFDRVGQVLKADLVGVRDASGDGARFARAVRRASEGTDMPLVLITSSADAMRQAAEPIAKKRPLLCAADSANVEGMAAVARDLKCPLVARDASLGGLADLTARAKAAGAEDLLIDPQPSTLRDLVEKSTVIRRGAVRRKAPALGYPILIDARGDPQAVLKATLATMKYGAVVLLDDLKPENALPLFVLRQNIYTDPQVPIQVKPGLFPVNGAGAGSPIVFTVNFSLTYFTVMQDVEKSKVPAWLLVVDTEGLSVLTAFSAGKLTPASVTAALEEFNAKERTSSDLLVMPGMIARMSGKLQEASGMKVIVGPKESSGLPKMLKTI